MHGLQEARLGVTGREDGEEKRGVSCAQEGAQKGARKRRTGARRGGTAGNGSAKEKEVVRQL